MRTRTSDIDLLSRTFGILPFGRNRRYGTDMNKGLDVAVGGWQFNNIVTWQSGPVFNVTCNGGRVDLIGDPTPTQAQEDQGLELNRAAFRCATTKFREDLPDRCEQSAHRTLGRNVFRGRPQFYWDASFFKNFPISAISEAFNVQFRFSAYNVLNRVNRSSRRATSTTRTNSGATSASSGAGRWSSPSS